MIFPSSAAHLALSTLENHQIRKKISEDEEKSSNYLILLLKWALLEPKIFTLQRLKSTYLRILSFTPFSFAFWGRSGSNLNQKNVEFSPWGPNNCDYFLKLHFCRDFRALCKVYVNPYINKSHNQTSNKKEAIGRRPDKQFVYAHRPNNRRSQRIIGLHQQANAAHDAVAVQKLHPRPSVSDGSGLSENLGFSGSP